ncbi:Glycosyltransferase, GT2 family [Roseivivax lentus]|uniref:Glycosyltransferase, GT2 family n=1 Tax=Roseivivax lentus TaxID=633194 RepID=A0A1N7P8P5_9RHOB|nr:glycosyltransferase family 2 protein [Roseivivax lentus]SIT06907.1 Glycosyltransferase, GT2 family [Roseivivax lentus]
MPSHEVAIIIPHYNDEIRLSRCLRALMPQLREGIHVIVVDNNSPRPPEVPAPIHLVIEPRKGAAHARNRGVFETKAHRIFFIDSDCVPAPNWVETGLRTCHRADLVGGKVTIFDETAPPRSGAEAFETVFAFDFQHYIENLGFSGSGNLLTHRGVFDTIGGFRDGLSEDFDWCQRARAAGFSLVFEPTLSVGHPSRSDWPTLKCKWRRLTRESFGLNGCSPRARLRWALRALAMPASIVVHASRVLRSPKLDHAERMRALITLARQRFQRMGWMLKQAAGFDI